MAIHVKYTLRLRRHGVRLGDVCTVPGEDIVMLKKLSILAGALALLWLALGAILHASPVVVLHYSAAATAPVTYFFNEDNQITKDHIDPGTSIEFRTAHRPRAGYFIEVSLPFASRDGVELKPPFSRVDVYIGADTRITRTVSSNEFLARFKSEL